MGSGPWAQAPVSGISMGILVGGILRVILGGIGGEFEGIVGSMGVVLELSCTLCLKRLPQLAC